MSRICEILKEKEYCRGNKDYYKKIDKDDNSWYYFFQNNDLVFSKKINITSEEYHNRCNDAYLAPTMYDYLNVVPNDYLVIYYNHYVNAYLIFAFYALGVNGNGFYTILKDGKCYNYKDINDWQNLNLPDQQINDFLDSANANINYLTDQKCTLRRTNYGEVLYDSSLKEKYNQELELFILEKELLISANKSATYIDNIGDKILEAFKTDNYQLLIDNINEKEYFAGKPLLEYVIDYDAVNIFNKLIENRELLNDYELAYKGSVVNEPIIHKIKNTMYFVKTLVNLGCDLNSRDVFGRNILYDVIETYDDELFDYIFNLDGLEIDKIPREKKLFTLEPNLEYNKETSLMPVLHYACLRGYYHAVLCIAPMVDIDASSEDVGTALYYAIAVNPKTEDHYKIIEYLLKCGANQDWYMEAEWPLNNGRSIKQLIEDSSDERLLSILDKYKKEDTNE